MNTEQKVDVMREAEQGKVIQFRLLCGVGEWTKIRHPSFNFVKYEYQVYITREERAANIYTKEVADKHFNDFCGGGSGFSRFHIRDAFLKGVEFKEKDIISTS